jgi:hypothetical protein
MILNCIPEEIGWSPIQHMVTLAAELLDARLCRVDDRQPGKMSKALSFAHRRRVRRIDHEGCLLVGAGPGDLAKILNVEDWRKKFGMVGAWIIDSFWTEYIPRSIALAKMFDVFFVTSLGDVDTWNQVSSGVPTIWLPWGTDALRLGGSRASREWDITRVGRQPPEWDNDDVAGQAAAARGIKYRPRPSTRGMSTLQNQQWIMNVYGETKFVLAFSNAANPEPYTHPTQQYLTGRWVDGLAGGAVLAGICPKGEGIEPLLWREATLEFETTRLDDGLNTLSEELPKWTPLLAQKNHAMALRKLDWRWRFKTLADNFGLKPSLLKADLHVLDSRISQLAIDEES